MINIFQLTTCNYSEGLIPLLSVFLAVDLPFQVVWIWNNSKKALFVLFLYLAHMFNCIRPLELPFDLEISIRNSCMHFCLCALSVNCSAAHLKPKKEHGVARAVLVTELTERLNAFKVRISKVGRLPEIVFHGESRDIRTWKSLVFPRNGVKSSSTELPNGVASSHRGCLHLFASMLMKIK